MTELPSHRFCVAPMMEWTDRHCRALHRTMSRRAMLYTEMVTSAAIIHGNPERLLGFSPQEQPVAVQLGGSDPDELAKAARVAAAFGYVEINLNVGCPSDRVQSGAFGACLMREPALVARCVTAMKSAVDLPVTVKCRLGVDDQDPHVALFAMTEALVAGGVDALVVHARKAWLKGLSPKENRDIPPLDYGLVHRLKQAFPQLPVIINGGLASLEEVQAQLAHVDGVMLGRAAYHNPMLLLGVDPLIFGDEAPFKDGHAVLRAYKPYLERELAQGTRLALMTRHLLGMFAGQPGARAFRRHLAEHAHAQDAGIEVVDEAMALVTPAPLPKAA
ncbi:MAG: tRNA dihydrouridine(20/20a) synthase DusA [Hyphomicrobiales bacterium]|nr:tRNA dihydrouridine(20/20a) synthase DusA [Hyphomicrobiales bacterium]